MSSFSSARCTEFNLRFCYLLAAIGAIKYITQPPTKARTLKIKNTDSSVNQYE